MITAILLTSLVKPDFDGCTLSLTYNTTFSNTIYNSSYDEQFCMRVMKEFKARDPDDSKQEVKIRSRLKLKEVI